MLALVPAMVPMPSNTNIKPFDVCAMLEQFTSAATMNKLQLDLARKFQVSCKNVHR